MMNNKAGIYLVIDPSMEEGLLLSKLSSALKEKLAAVQIWDNFNEEQNIPDLVQKVCELCHAKKVPVFINNRYDLLSNTNLDGVHFDEIPENYSELKVKIGKPFLSGLTCNNDLEWIRWANENKLDYISFCSIFPSSTAISCDLVEFETIQKASETFTNSIFLAGGIKPENIEKLSSLKYNGVAVVSGIMSSDTPDLAIKQYQEKLNRK
ncbi:thiamine phosphate synthase [uncultured Arcticibacterium sp.]|uniref:thiamine phosphate synthase n=1 Tax=uncultured Arcticibacterium sp. TaxID=2173042 RepID=UPI0030FBB2DB